MQTVEPALATERWPGIGWTEGYNQAIFQPLNNNGEILPAGFALAPQNEDLSKPDVAL